MSETEQLIAALRQNLAARLAFRRQPLIDAIQAVKSKATKNGNINSGRMGITIALPYGEEARMVAECIDRGGRCYSLIGAGPFQGEPQRSRATCRGHGHHHPKEKPWTPLGCGRDIL